jgi:hypothetical protein
MVKLTGRHMETDTLLRVTPKEIAESLLLRRRVLKEQLPNIVKTLDGEGESLSPKVKKIKEKNETIKVNESPPHAPVSTHTRPNSPPEIK